MNPVIARYSDFSSSSIYSIQAKFEPLKTHSKKRVYKEEKDVDHHVLYNKPDSKFTPRSIVLVDSVIPEKPKVSKKPRPCTARKPKLDQESNSASLDWNFKPLSKHRENWIFSLVKPETEFYPKPHPKKIPVSYQAILLKNLVSDQPAQKEFQRPPVPADQTVRPAMDQLKDFDLPDPQADRSNLPDCQAHDLNPSDNPIDSLKPVEKISEPLGIVVNHDKHEFPNSSPSERFPAKENIDNTPQKKSISKYFPVNASKNNFLSEYKSQFVDSNTAKALQDLKKAYNLK
jgi:hypothetical protein